MCIILLNVNEKHNAQIVTTAKTKVRY